MGDYGILFISHMIGYTLPYMLLVCFSSHTPAGIQMHALVHIYAQAGVPKNLVPICRYLDSFCRLPGSRFPAQKNYHAI